MKKLLDELQSLKNEYNPQKYTTDADIVFGIDRAIIAVRDHNPWYDMTEKPPRQENRLHSEKVFVANECDEATCEGYYDFDICRWRRYHDDMIISPTRWTYLPELP